jgi:hypothetical protein
MANTIDSGLNQVIISQATLEAFTSAFAPIMAFTTDFSPDAQEKYDTINVPYVSASSAAVDFSASYNAQDSTIAKKQITLSGHKYVSWYLTDKQIAKSPVLSLQRFAKQKGYQLAKAVFQDIASAITAANFSTAALVSTAANTDSDDIVDVKAACDNADMPEAPRSLVLKSDYVNALLKDNAVQDAAAFGNAQAIQEGRLPRIAGFELHQTNLIPSNSENLVGFAAYPSAIAVAVRYLQPQGQTADGIYLPVTHPETGLTLGYREWYDNSAGARIAVMECFYGYVLAEASALKRITSS